MAVSDDMADYMRNRREERRIILREMLGDQCLDCGSQENLEFDHIDPATKVFTIANGLDGDWDTLVAEVMKCELRCRPCHITRSVALGHCGALRGELNGMWVEALHGTGKMYGQGCKCPACRQWKRDYRAKRVDSRGRPLPAVAQLAEARGR